MIRYLLILLMLASTAGATTYHVRDSTATAQASDGNNGTAWSTAWATVAKVNDNLDAGDTVLFGTGRFRKSQIVPPLDGTYSMRTVYACSLFNQIGDSTEWLDGGGDWRSIISGGQVVTGWSNVEDDVYKAYFDPAIYYENNTCYCLTQDDSLLKPQTYYDSVVATAGYFKHQNDTLYVHCFGDGDPGDYTMEASSAEVVPFHYEAAKHFLFYGLDLRMGKQAVVFYYRGADSIEFYHCFIGYSGHKPAENSALIFSKARYASDVPDYNWGEWLMCKDCTFGPVTAEASGAAHSGAAFDLYFMRYVKVESCMVCTNWSVGGGIGFKNAGYEDYGQSSIGNCVCFCQISGPGVKIAEDGVWLNSKCEYDSVYGNIIYNCEYSAIRIGGSSAMDDPEVRGNLFIANNTFYGCDNWFYINRIQDNTGNNIIKWNIGYHRLVGDVNWGFDDYHFVHEVNTGYNALLTLYDPVDSNCYYTPGVNFSAAVYEDAGGDKTFAEWQAMSRDVHSDTSNPDFDDTTTWTLPSDTRLSGCTNYGRWPEGQPTIYGAVQPPPPPPPPPTYMRILKGP